MSRLAAEVREAQGITAVRGRLPREAFLAFFATHPKRAREVARLAGVTLPARGRLSRESLTALAEIVR